MHWNLNFPVKGQLNYLLSRSCPSLPLPSCSLQAGDPVCGHHCLAGCACFLPPGLSALLPDQSEEEGQEGCCPGKDCPKCWQRGWGRGLQTGWWDHWQYVDDDMCLDMTSDCYFFLCVNLHRWSRTSPNSASTPKLKLQRNPRALRWTLK